MNIRFTPYVIHFDNINIFSYLYSSLLFKFIREPKILVFLKLKTNFWHSQYFYSTVHLQHCLKEENINIPYLIFVSLYEDMKKCLQ